MYTTSKQQEIVRTRIMNRDCSACKKDIQKDYVKKNNLNSKKMPSKCQQAKNFTKAVAAHIHSGIKNTKDDVYKKRISICTKCEYITKNGRCMKCGCIMRIKSKWAEQKCPEGRW